MPGPAPSFTSPRCVMSGVSVARMRSSWIATSGFNACAAVTAPRRLNSSCTENTRCSVGPLGSALQRARHFEHHRAAGAVVDRGADDAVVGDFQHVRRIDDRRADHHAGGGDLRGAAVAAIDVELGIRQDLVFLLRLGGVMALVGDDAGDGLALAAPTRAPTATAAPFPARRRRARPAAGRWPRSCAPPGRAGPCARTA